MALQQNIFWIKNQPVKISSPVSECDTAEIDYKSIVNADDITKFQVKLFPIQNAPQLLSESEFTDFTLSDWTHTGLTHLYYPQGLLYNSDNLGYTLEQTLDDISATAFVQIQIGIIRNNCGFFFSTNNNSTTVDKDVVGTQTFYSMFGTSTPKKFQLYHFPKSGKDFKLDFIRMKEVDLNYVILIRNLNTDVVEYSYFLRDYITTSNPYGTSPFLLIDNVLTVTIDWSDLSLTEGCYRIEICDPAINTNLQNSIPNWDFIVNDLSRLDISQSNVTAVINDASQLYVTASASGSHVYLINSEESSANGVVYNIDIKVDSLNVGSGTDITLTYGFTGNITVLAITTSQTISATATGNGDKFYFSIIMSHNANIKIDYVKLRLNNENDYDGNYYSNDFMLANDSCDNILITACSDNDNTFGFYFPSSVFHLSARLQGRATNANYQVDRETYVDNEGNVRTTYFNRRKIKSIKIFLVPEYMLDFLSLLGGIDHIYIDGIEYVADKDEYISINYDSGIDNYAKVQLFLFEKDSAAINKACYTLGLGCSTDIECLIDPDDSTCVIDPITAESIVSLEEN